MTTMEAVNMTEAAAATASAMNVLDTPLHVSESSQPLEPQQPMGNGTTFDPTAIPTSTRAGDGGDASRNGGSGSGTNGVLSPTPTALQRKTWCAYRGLALLIVTLALVFSLGFGLGVRYSHKQCRCAAHSGSVTSTSSSATNTTSTPSINGGCSTSDGNAKESGSNGETDSSSSSNSGTTFATDDGNDDGASEWSSSLPPMVTETVSCLDDSTALDELRTAIFTHAHAYILNFGSYIRHGGNNTYFVDNRHNGTRKPYGWLFDTNDSSNATTASTSNRSLQSTTTAATATGGSSTRNKPFQQRSLRQTSAKAATAETDTAVTTPTRHVPIRQEEKATRRRRTRSSLSNSSSSSDSSGVIDRGSKVETADIVQSNGEYVFVAYNEDEIVVLHSVTSSIVERIRIPRRHSDSRIKGMLIVNKRRGDKQQVEPLDEQYLVVLVQEEDNNWDNGSSYDTPSNTTVLVYDVMNHDGNGAAADAATYANDLTLVAQHSLAGRYSQAYTVHGTLQVHIVTTTMLDLYSLTEYLTPAYLQGTMNNATNNTDHTSSSSSSSTADDELPQPPPPLLLNEAQYLELALAQLDLQLERFVTQQAALLDCTGFVPLAHRPGRNGTNMILSGPNTFVNIVTLNVSTSMSTAQESSGKSAMSVLPPGNDAESNMILSDINLVLICELWSGSNFTIASQPLSWLVTFDLPSAFSTGMALTSVGIVPGVVSSTDMNHVSTNGSNHLRVIMAQYNSIDDYYGYNSNGNGVPSQVQLVVLEMTDTTSSTVTSNSNSEFIMPIVGKVSDFGINGSALASVVSVLFEEAVVHLVVGTATTPNDLKSILYTIDVTAASNPRVVGQLEMANSSITYLHKIRNEQNVDISSSSSGNGNNDTVLLAVGVTIHPDDADDSQYPEERLHLVLVNVSTPDPQASLSPAGPRLIQQWHQEPPSKVPDINSTTDSSVVKTASVFEYRYSGRDIASIVESNIVVVPARIESFRYLPCPIGNEDGGSSWAYDDDSWLSSNNATEKCQYQEVESIEFDGFWLFKIHLPKTSTTGATTNITRHFAIDHGLPALTPSARPGCNQNGLPLTARSYVFDGDIMTVKGDSVLTFDLLTKTEAAPPVLLQRSDCNTL